MTGAGGYSRTVEQFTPRQREVLVCGTYGDSIAETAVKLGIAEGTVRVIRASCVQRAHATNWMQVVVMYARGEVR